MASKFSDSSICSDAPSWELLSNDDSSSRGMNNDFKISNNGESRDPTTIPDVTIPSSWDSLSDTDQDDEQSTPKLRMPNDNDNEQPIGFGAIYLRADDAEGRCVHEVFKQQVISNADSLAVDAWDGTLTYGELNELSSKLAHHLCDLGVGPEVMVPLFFEKSVWAIVSTLAVLKAGGSFVPMDSSESRASLKRHVQELGAKVMLMSPLQASPLEGLVQTAVVVSPHLLNFIDNKAGDPQVAVFPDNAATVFYMSDIDNSSKVFIRKHAAVCTKSQNYATRWFMNPSSRVFQYAKYTDITSTVEIFAALQVGACLCVPSDHEIENDILRVMNDMEITWVALPSWLSDALAMENVPSIQTIVCAVGAVKGGVGGLFADSQSETDHDNPPQPTRKESQPSNMHVFVEQQTPRASTTAEFTKVEGSAMSDFHLDVMNGTQQVSVASNELGSALDIMNGKQRILETMSDTQVTTDIANNISFALDIMNGTQIPVMDTQSVLDSGNCRKYAFDIMNGAKLVSDITKETQTVLATLSDPTPVNGTHPALDVMNGTNSALDIMNGLDTALYIMNGALPIFETGTDIQSCMDIMNNPPIALEAMNGVGSSKGVVNDTQFAMYQKSDTSSALKKMMGAHQTTNNMNGSQHFLDVGNGTLPGLDLMSCVRSALDIMNGNKHLLEPLRAPPHILDPIYNNTSAVDIMNGENTGWDFMCRTARGQRSLQA